VESKVGGVPGAAALGGGRGPAPDGDPSASGDRRVHGDERASALLAIDAETSIGAYLRTQRQLRGIGLDELEAVTRIPRRSLARLEAGEYDARPDGFVRSFVRAVAGALGLDPDETVARMLAEPTSPPPRWEVGATPVRLVTGVALLLLVLAAAAAWWATAGGGAAGGAESEPAVVWRHDPVRELAESAARGDEIESPEPR